MSGRDPWSGRVVLVLSAAALYLGAIVGAWAVVLGAGCGVWLGVVLVGDARLPAHAGASLALAVSLGAFAVAALAWAAAPSGGSTVNEVPECAALGRRPIAEAGAFDRYVALDCWRSEGVR